jgi:hypothetical protein
MPLRQLKIGQHPLCSFRMAALIPRPIVQLQHFAHVSPNGEYEIAFRTSNGT